MPKHETELTGILVALATPISGDTAIDEYGLPRHVDAANFIPDLAVQLWEAVAVRRDLDEGRRLWRRIWPICDFLEAHDYVAGVKAGMELTGQSAGPARRPVLPLTASERKTFASVLEAAGLEVTADA